MFDCEKESFDVNTSRIFILRNQTIDRFIIGMINSLRNATVGENSTLSRLALVCYFISLKIKLVSNL
jgi:hypothetical protein